MKVEAHGTNVEIHASALQLQAFSLHEIPSNWVLCKTSLKMLFAPQLTFTCSAFGSEFYLWQWQVEPCRLRQIMLWKQGLFPKMKMLCENAILLVPRKPSNRVCNTAILVIAQVSRLLEITLPVPMSARAQWNCYMGNLWDKSLLNLNFLKTKPEKIKLSPMKHLLK